MASMMQDKDMKKRWFLWKDAFERMSKGFESTEFFARLVNLGGDLICTRKTMPLYYALTGEGEVNLYRDKYSYTVSGSLSQKVLVTIFLEVPQGWLAELLQLPFQLSRKQSPKPCDSVILTRSARNYGIVISNTETSNSFIFQIA